MLNAYPNGQATQDSLAGHSWIDLVDPTEPERATFAAAFKLRVPSQNELGEIEATSRLQAENGALYMTAPLIFAAPDKPWVASPTGFVLSKQVLMTVRFGPSAAFDLAAKECGNDAKLEPATAFVTILEELIAHLADLLEAAGHELDDASHTIFRPGHEKLSRETAMLRQLMIRTGRVSERMARAHYTLVCLDRMAKFAADRARDWIAAELLARLQSVSSDVTSLVQFSEGLVSRVQLLQDAATGIINIDQNDVMKVLTVASVVGIPPVLIAGIYGMNFKNMPEYDWHWGYQWGLALIVISAIIPFVWFKWKDWI
jgi:magnesium transporter